MILVMEAGYHGVVAFSARKTLPLSTSTRITASAAQRGTAKPKTALAAIATANMRAAAEWYECIRFAVRSSGRASETLVFHGREFGRLSKPKTGPKAKLIGAPVP